MVFTNKPKKKNSILVKDKRKIILLNSDFKILMGIEAKRHKNLLDHTVSSFQFASGNNKQILHIINLARDAIFFANREKEGVGLADLDFQSAFDLLCMSWVEHVLSRNRGQY